MSEIMLVNGSPRAPRSNSKRYAKSFQEQVKVASKYFNISKINHKDIITEFHNVTDVVFVFPLYVDGIPSTLLEFLKSLESNEITAKPTISVLINCGFLEYRQNDIAIEMIRLFCKQNSYNFGSILSIGGGEAVLDTPFNFLVQRKIKAFAKSISSKKYRKITFTMPLTKKLYIKASTNYWTKYGLKNGVTKEEMEIMTIE